MSTLTPHALHAALLEAARVSYVVTADLVQA